MAATSLSIRPMTLADVPAAWAIQLQAYADPDLHEAINHFKRKLANYPQGCWVAETTNEDAQHQGEQQQSAASAAVVVGYLVSYPSRLDDPPVLSNDEWCVPHPADAYFIHEVTVDPRRQGLGVGRLLCAKAIECARRFGEIHQSGEGGEGRRSVRFVALISVQGSSRRVPAHSLLGNIGGSSSLEG